MHIELKDIQKLFSTSPNLLKGSFPSYCLTGWLHLRNAPVPYTTHFLYVCEYNENLRDFSFLAGMHILCLTDNICNLEQLAEEFPPSINLLFLRNEDPNIIYEGLMDFFNTQCGIGLFADTLLEILSSDGGIQAMIDHAYYAFGNPIFVFDTGFHLIAANWEEARKAEGGDELIENKRFTDREFEMANSRNHIHARVQKSTTPILAHNPELGYDQLLCAIDNKKDLGHIVVSAVNRPLNSIDSNLLLILKKCIDQQLKKNEFIRNAKGFNYEYFLKDVLDGKIATGKPFLDRFDYVSSEFSGNMYCLVIETARSSSTLNTYHVRNLFEGRFPNSKTLMYNGGIIGVFSLPADQFLSKKHLADAVKICKENDLFAGLSNCFQNIIEIPEYYKQALRAIELGICTMNEANLFLYENYYLEHLKNIFVQKESSNTFCHPNMKLLLNYDEKHHSELAYTLYMYLIHERNIAAASKAMHMHRNSLVYRIQKINTLIDDNFESYRERQYLILSYELQLPSS